MRWRGSLRPVRTEGTFVDSTTTRAAGYGEQKYDIAVAYRIYPKVAKPAQSLPFGDDKLRQAEICLRSFRDSLGSLRVKLWAILDGCPREYRELFQRYFAPADLVLIEADGIGNRATYAKQLDILLAQCDAEYVYFAEDDYLYLPGQFPLMLQFLCAGQDVDFVTPYDHPECYYLALHREPKWLRVFEGHHWRTAASTCLTFLTRKSTLAKYEKVLRTYARRNDDCPMWLSLTKRRVFDVFAMLQCIVRREFYPRTPCPVVLAILLAANSFWQDGEIVGSSAGHCHPTERGADVPGNRLDCVDAGRNERRRGGWGLRRSNAVGKCEVSTGLRMASTEIAL